MITESLAEPIIKIKGTVLTVLPQDLYIPPDALQVFLEAFEGPLDLLLYLIQKENLDILELPIASITEQYKRYVELMKALNLELAAEYLVMAAWLAEIKSRLLLPRPKLAGQEEVDPRAELIRRLQEYEQIKAAAESLSVHPQEGQHFFCLKAQAPEQLPERKIIFTVLDLCQAVQAALKRNDLKASHFIAREPLSVRERMTCILVRLEQKKEPLYFYTLFTQEEGARGVVVAFIAILELVKERLIMVEQTEIFGSLSLRLFGCPP